MAEKDISGAPYSAFDGAFRKFYESIQAEIDIALSSAREHANGVIANFAKTNRMLVDEKLGKLKGELVKGYEAAIKNQLGTNREHLRNEIKKLGPNVRKAFETDIASKVEPINERLKELEGKVKQYEGNLKEQIDGVKAFVSKKGGELSGQYKQQADQVADISSRVKKIESIEGRLIGNVKKVVQEAVAKVKFSPEQTAVMKMQVNEYIDQLTSKEALDGRIKSRVNKIKSGQDDEIGPMPAIRPVAQPKPKPVVQPKPKPEEKKTKPEEKNSESGSLADYFTT